MNIRTAFALTFLGLATLACGGGGSSGDFGGMPSASVSEPWSSMALPINDGTVLYSDGTSISVNYSKEDAANIGSAYNDAITKAGWSQTSQVGDASSYVGSYSKDGKTLSLAVSASAGMTTVNVSQM